MLLLIFYSWWPQPHGILAGCQDGKEEVSFQAPLTSDQTSVSQWDWPTLEASPVLPRGDRLSCPGAWLGEHCQLSQCTARCCQSHCCTVFPSYRVIITSSAIGGVVQSAVNPATHAVTSSLVCHARDFITFPVTRDSQSGKTTIQG